LRPASAFRGYDRADAGRAYPMMDDTQRPFESTPLASPRFREKARGVRHFEDGMNSDE
jgi:hypothetical protein